MAQKQTHIIFYGKVNEDGKRDTCIQDITQWSTRQMADLIEYQTEMEGRKEYHLKSGYPVYCNNPDCRVTVILSPVEHDTRVLLCDVCQSKANINHSKLLKAYDVLTI